MSDNTPTERFETPPAAAAAGVEPRSRRLLYILIGVGAALVIAIIILLIVLLTRNSGDEGSTDAKPSPSISASESASPTASETPSDSPTPSPSETVAAPPADPDPTGARFTTFSPVTNEDGCHKGGEGPFQDAQVPNIRITWKTADAVEAWFITGTDDAADSRFMQIPLSGNQDDFPYPIAFSCNEKSVTYTITLVQDSNTHVSKSWTVKNTGDKF